MLIFERLELSSSHERVNGFWRILLDDKRRGSRYALSQSRRHDHGVVEVSSCIRMQSAPGLVRCAYLSYCYLSQVLKKMRRKSKAVPGPSQCRNTLF